MPDRIVRTGILTSEAVNKLTPGGEVFYRRLLNLVDDFGRSDGRLSVLLAALYPLKIAEVREKDIAGWINECVAADLLVLYVVDEKVYLQVDKLGKPRAKVSKWPQTPADAYTRKHMFADDNKCTVVVVVDVVVGVGGAEQTGAHAPAPPPQTRVSKPRKSTKAPETPLPEGFAVSDRVRRWAEGRGLGAVIDQHCEAFVLKCRAKGYRRVDWDAALMVAVTDNWANISPASNPENVSPM